MLHARTYAVPIRCFQFLGWPLSWFGVSIILLTYHHNGQAATQRRAQEPSAACAYMESTKNTRVHSCAVSRHGHSSLAVFTLPCFLNAQQKAMHDLYTHVSVCSVYPILTVFAFDLMMTASLTPSLRAMSSTWVSRKLIHACTRRKKQRQTRRPSRPIHASFDMLLS
jgi:hypothetical protein